MFIKDSAENVQIEAIKLIGKLYKIKSLIPILISKLKNKSPDIRKAAVLSLMQLNIKVVSYTNLTLPTTLRVKNCGVAVSLQKNKIIYQYQRDPWRQQLNP